MNDAIGETPLVVSYCPLTGSGLTFNENPSVSTSVGKSWEICLRRRIRLPLPRPRSTTPGYWNRPELNERTIVDGWLRTGDQYVRDEDGYFQYQGRADDMIKVGGIWCSPFDIEARLIEHATVLEAAVVGREDDHGLVKPEAHVVLTEPLAETVGAESAADALESELVRHCQGGLPKYMYPRWIHFVAELPKTATGKIQRFKLRQ